MIDRLFDTVHGRIIITLVILAYVGGGITGFTLLYMMITPLGAAIVAAVLSLFVTSAVLIFVILFFIGLYTWIRTGNWEIPR